MCFLKKSPLKKLILRCKYVFLVAQNVFPFLQIARFLKARSETSPIVAWLLIIVFELLLRVPVIDTSWFGHLLSVLSASVPACSVSLLARRNCFLLRSWHGRERVKMELALTTRSMWAQSCIHRRWFLEVLSRYCSNMMRLGSFHATPSTARNLERSEELLLVYSILKCLNCWDKPTNDRVIILARAPIHLTCTFWLCVYVRGCHSRMHRDAWEVSSCSQGVQPSSVGRSPAVHTLQAMLLLSRPSAHVPGTPPGQASRFPAGQ